MINQQIAANGTSAKFVALARIASPIRQPVVAPSARHAPDARSANWVGKIGLPPLSVVRSMKLTASYRP